MLGEVGEQVAERPFRPHRHSGASHLECRIRAWSSPIWQSYPTIPSPEGAQTSNRTPGKILIFESGG
jgi:hypothetical protein